MNKIYKLVWNQVRGCYVVASEFAKAHGKSARRAVVGAFVAAAMVSGAASAYAAGTVADGSQGAIIRGEDVQASGKDSSAIGRENIAIGNYSLAAGFLSTANGNCSIAMGRQSLTGDKAFDAIALGYQAMAYGDRSVAMGFYSRAFASVSMAVGLRSEAHGYNSFAAMGGNTGDGAANAMAFGVGAKALKANTYAIGNEAEAQGNDTIAFGSGAKAMQANGVAFGHSALAQGDNAVAMGADARAQAADSVAIGHGSVAGTANTVSVGSAGHERKIVYVADGELKADSKEVVNGGQLFIEIERAKAAEKVNATAIAEETTRAKATEETLTNNVNYINYSVNDLDNRVTTAEGNIDTQVRLMSELLLDNAVGARNIIFSNGIEGSLVERDGDTKLVLGLKDKFDANEHFTFTDKDRSNYSVDVSNKGFIAEDHNTNGDYNSTLNEKGLKVTRNGSGVSITANGIDMGGTKVTGLGKGELSVNSKDAVNGAQLYATNEAVRANTKAIIDETTRAAAAEKTNADAIAANKIAINDNANAISLEETRAKAAEEVNANAIASNTQAIAFEIIRADITEKELKDNINLIDHDMNDLISRVSTAEGIVDTQAKFIAEKLLEQGIGPSNIDFGNGLEGKLIPVAGGDPRLVIGLKDEFGTNDRFTFKDKENRSNYSVEVSTKGFVAEDTNKNGYFNSTLNEEGLKVTRNGSGVTITANGIDMGGTKVAGLGKGELSAESTDAVNGAQLFATNEAVKANTDAIAANKIAINDNANAISLETTRAKAAEKANFDNITTNAGNIAALRTDLSKDEARITKNETDIEAITTKGFFENKENITFGESLTGDIVENSDGSHTFYIDVNKKAFVKFKDDDRANLDVDLSSKGLRVLDSNDAGSFDATYNEMGMTVAHDNDQVSVSADGILVGKKPMGRAAGDASYVEITKTGIDMGGNKINNLANGVDDTDAVNVAQLKAEANRAMTAEGALSSRMNQLDGKINRTGAHAAALAALRPADYDGKLSVAAGMGTYHGSQAAALGLFYKVSDRICFNMGGSLGSGDKMGNFGISFALDRSVKGEPSKRDLLAETKELKAENAQLKARLEKYEVQELRAENAEMKARMAELEAMIKALANK